MKNCALSNVYETLKARKDEILTANQLDKNQAEADMLTGKVTSALYKRLDLSGSKYESVLSGVQRLITLPDPVGQITMATELDEGLKLYRVTCPFGVLCIIFEARPEAIVQIPSLALKTANAVILKGGHEAKQSNMALVESIRMALSMVDGFPVDAVQLVNTREEIASLLSFDQYIDLVIPRGSNALVRHIQTSTKIPVMGHADGICAVYVDEDADESKAVRIVVDAKTQYPAACNAAETLLIHASAVPRLLAPIGRALTAAKVSLKADERSLAILKECGANVEASTEDDYHTEFLDLVMAVKVVDSCEEAIQHINSHGSHHTDAIVTEDPAVAEVFLSKVDSADVFHNASTRFADGFRFGFGAEVGISTARTHARGPVGMEGLLIYKYRLYGSGHIVQDYEDGRATFRHMPIDATMLPKSE
eukprot:TRINITY_DN11144_c0_g1::TRINITY_DN11144_c0_g1_i1::g.6493::m.6493 TRINITY_DN11144_c0_g1::TRINITY_DN11144_c0_g1_i1::g.6493  ORF type:complete len:433 (+),score=80.51,sp/Q9UT44/PROA_SCHPO/52.09/1e-151,Aldedh/PF00171.17/2.5e-11,Aldedh/PF00171.17/0.002 TRINITY_DN11144_c0_g1_i1:36-1301(+)